MIIRPNPQLLQLLRPSVPASSVSYQCVRQLHNRIPQRPVPQPTPFVPDVNTFLTVIGRKLSQHAAKIPTWEALFSLSSEQLRELGVEPARSRRYLLHWREKFRNGEYGVAGDAKHVKDGVAEVRIAEVPSKKTAGVAQLATATSSPGMRKVVVNVPQDVEVSEQVLRSGKPLQGLKVKGARTIVGPYVEAVSDNVARIAVREGLWEERRGHKVDGGERRKAEVREEVSQWILQSFSYLKVGETVPCDESLESARSIEHIKVDGYTGHDEDTTCFSVHNVVLDVQVYRLQDDEESATLLTLTDGDRTMDDSTSHQIRMVSLPNIDLDGLWESLAYPGNIHVKLLRLATRMCGRGLAQKLKIRLGKVYTHGKMIEIQPESLFSKYFGESGKIIAQIFDQIQSTADSETETLICVMIDEVESLVSPREQSMFGEVADAIRVMLATRLNGY
ncbi:telomere length regulation protein [Diplodia seriata]